jgi:hypothetical protein
VASDHPRPLRLKSKVAWALARPRPRSNGRGRIDRAALADPDKATEYVLAAAQLLAAQDSNGGASTSERLSQAMAEAATATLTSTDRRRPDWFERKRTDIMDKATARNSALQRHLQATAALHKFVDRGTQVDRDNANALKRTVRRTKDKLKRTRHAVKKQVKEAKEEAFMRVAKDVNQKGHAAVWQGVTTIKGGIHKLWQAAPRMLKKADGTKCKTERENKVELSEHFEKVLNIDYGHEPAVMDDVVQRPVWNGTVAGYPNLDACPHRRELRRTMRLLAPGKATGDSKVCAEMLKVYVNDAIAEDEVITTNDEAVQAAAAGLRTLRATDPANTDSIARAEQQLHQAEDRALAASRNGDSRSSAGQLEDALLQCVVDFWNTGVCDPQWVSLRLKTMPKKQPADEANKFRGIYLIDIIAKVLHKLTEQRLQLMLNKNGLEEQSGFTPGRGTADGTFALKQAILKAREYQQPVWMAFLDLVKAFPSNSRVAMWACLAKYGTPPTLLARVKALHTNMHAKFELEHGEDAELPNTSGGIQGSCLASPTFNIVMQCALEVAKKLGNINGVGFYTATEDTVGSPGRGLMGANWRKVGSREPLHFWVSLYADDAAQGEPSRARLQTSFNDVVNTLARFGLKVHLATTADGSSKTECMVFLPPGVAYASVDTSPLQVDRGFATFTRIFCYLGTLVSDDGCDDKAVEDRISKASAVFGALRKELFGNRNISNRVKAVVWEALVAAVLLFGAECWCLTAKSRSKLIRFQRRCVRTMCGTTRWRTWKTRTSADELARLVGVTPVETLYARKALAWLGHVVRMPHTRLCRRLAFAWMAKPRKKGGQMLNWGHTMVGSKGLLPRAAKTVSPAMYRRLGFRGGANEWKTKWLSVAQDRMEWATFVREVTFKA